MVVNGWLVPDWSTPALSVPDGLTIRRLVDSTPGAEVSLEPYWRGRSHGYPHLLRALNDAAAPDPVIIELAPGCVVDDPIEVVYVAQPEEDPCWAFPRLIVTVGAGAKATLVESYVSASGGVIVGNGLTQVELGSGADVLHFVFQAEDRESLHLSFLEARLGESSRFRSRLLATGARVGRHEVEVLLAGRGGTVELDGLFVSGESQQHDNVLLVTHAAPDCTSRQIYKGIVRADGRGVFNGRVDVRPGADGTEARQVNKNLLLSDQAEVDARPRLEIHADDVVCTHGAAVGGVDPEALFYLRSRAISEERAQALLAAGFAREFLDRFAPGPLRERAGRQLRAAGIASLELEDEKSESATTAWMVKQAVVPAGRH
uniref:Fe-S cluster assembly protein SufD n=1 Tax=Aciditerrimonas ferrireducens TaxID=667306 RepID=UPI00366B22E1